MSERLHETNVGRANAREIQCFFADSAMSRISVEVKYRAFQRANALREIREDSPKREKR